MSEASPRRVAVVLFNLGGPDRPESVRPFLFNLFNDPAIIQAPTLLRTPLAALISTTRAKGARANYAIMGGASPLLAETQAQTRALQALLDPTEQATKVFIAMRYWKPFCSQTAAEVAAFAPDDVVLLPLYPQFSTTTTGSSAKAWARAYRGPGRVRMVCCYPTLKDFVAAHAARIEAAYAAAGSPPRPRLLFSAHGLPEKIIAAGDPYQVQIEATAAAVAERLGSDWDWQVCYQSRVGPLKWLGPSTPEAIAAAGEAGLGLVVTPIAFVSEHIETLVELDHEYAELAESAGCPYYVRVPALGIEPAFIDALAGLVGQALAWSDGAAQTGEGGRWCAADWSACPAR